jgi:hypothetical protein
VTEVRSADLLRALGSSTSAPGAGAPVAPGGPDFAELLGRAREGALETGLPVTVAHGSGVELSSEQLEQLSKVVDRAHSAGATRIVVLMDGVALDVDVLSRRVLGTAELQAGRVLTGVDGIVRLGSDEAASGGPLPPPGAGAIAPSLRRALASSESAA